jgi:ABC-2 type transport system permease protein
MGPLRPAAAVVIRSLAFVGKELAETFRRPGAIVSLIVGPFLILAVFGLGYNGIKRPLDTIIVADAASGLPTDVATYQRLAGGGMRIEAVTEERAAAERRLDEHTVDVVIVTPEDPVGRFETGEQSVIEVRIDEVDPVQTSYAGILAAALANEVNREIIERVAAESQGYALAGGDAAVATIPPEVIAAPTRAEVINGSPSQPDVVGYFGPAVLALILQHLAVTLVALSLVRERTSGVIELFRIAPVSPFEVMAGKILAFLVLGGAIAGLTLALLVGGLGVPMLGDPWLVGLAVILLLLASLGLGLLIAVVSDSERQAVQLSLLILLASVFFSGFVLSIEEFTVPVRAIAASLPVTHGISLLQDLMLRGSTDGAIQYLALVTISAVTLIGAWLLLRRIMSRAT